MASLQPMPIFLSLPPESWNYRHRPPQFSRFITVAFKYNSLIFFRDQQQLEHRLGRRQQGAESMKHLMLELAQANRRESTQNKCVLQL